MNEQKMQVSSANDFRPTTYLLQLPSNRVVRIRQVDLVGLLVSNDGDIPDFLTAQVVRGMTGQTQNAAKMDINRDNVVEVFKFINLIVMVAVAEPTVVASDAKYDEGEINIDDFSTDDKQWIFQTALPQEVGAAMSFHARVEAANLAIVSGRKTNSESSIAPVESA